MSPGVLPSGGGRRESQGPRVVLGERLEATIGSEDGRGCEPTDTGGLQTVGQARKDAPLAPPKEPACGYLGFSPVRPILDF